MDRFAFGLIFMTLSAGSWILLGIKRHRVNPRPRRTTEQNYQNQPRD
jgi:hypothetical protein